MIYSTEYLEAIGVRVEVIDRIEVSWSPNNPKLLVFINGIVYNIYTNTYNRLLKSYSYKLYNECYNILYETTKDETYKKAS